MNLKVDIPVRVIFTSNPKNNKAYPISIAYDGRDYKVTKIGLHHNFRLGRTLYHIFSVVCQDTFFRLSLNTDNLLWRLEEVSDGLPD